MFESIFVYELKNIPNISLIDIRSVERFNNNHIPNARNIPFEKLITNPSFYLNRDNKYYIYCQKGITSRNACQILTKQGYNVVNITGGYEAWLLRE